MATIVSLPVRAAPRIAGATASEKSARARLTSALLAVAAPVLAAGLCWGMVDALAFTQSSLMGLYCATAA